MNSEFFEEVKDRVAGFFEIFQNADGRWTAILCPEAINPTGGDIGKLPPGQDTYVGFDGYVTCNELYEQAKDATGIDREMILRSSAYKDAWAARPYFKSPESASRMLVCWAFKERRDIVDMCIDETKQAVAYRKNRGAA